MAGLDIQLELSRAAIPLSTLELTEHRQGGKLKTYKKVVGYRIGPTGKRVKAEHYLGLDRHRALLRLQVLLAAWPDVEARGKGSSALCVKAASARC